MQCLMIVSILAEIAGRLGLLKDLKLPSPPFPSSLATPRALASIRAPPLFQFELINGRYQADRIRLSLLTGDTTGQALAAAAASRKAALTAAVAAAVGNGSSCSGGSNQGPLWTEARHTQTYGTTGMEEIREVGNASSSSSQPEAVSSAHSPLNKTAVNPNESHGSTAAALPALTTPRPRAYVVTLKGDMFLSQGAYLTSVVSFLLETARSGPGGDELVLLLESGGGAAYEYGLSAAQLERLRRAGIRLTVCVDKIAASGGYMLAVVADTLVTAPFATIGSIGATTSVPVLNVGVALKRLGIHAYSIKAGKHKGSGGMLLVGDAKGDQEALGKLREDLAKVHEAFKAHIGRWRKMVDVEAVGTGEVWQGREAKALGLVDEIMTSEEYLAWRLFTHDVVKVSPAPDARRFPGSFFLPGGGGRGGGAPLGPTAAMAVLTSIREMIARRGVKRIGGVLVDEEEKAGVSVADRVLHSVASLLLGQKAPLIIC